MVCICAFVKHASASTSLAHIDAAKSRFGSKSHASGSSTTPSSMPSFDVAARQHGVGEDLELAQALRRAVAVGIEGEIAGVVVAEHALQQPRVAGVELLIPEHGRAGDDAVEVVRETLRLDEPFAAARRAALEIRCAAGRS